LLEGEGYFGVINSKVGGKLYRYPRIGINMTDRDVIERVSHLWNAKIFVMQPKGISKKVGYRVTINGNPAAAWMRWLHSLMGIRRRAQIDKSLEEWDRVGDPNERRRASCRQAVKKRSRKRNGTFDASVRF
jgi:hypothetical protein